MSVEQQQHTQRCSSEEPASLLTRPSLPLFSPAQAGKYIPYLATALLSSSPSIPLVSIAIGDGWVDPLKQTAVYAEQAFNLGIIHRFVQECGMRVRWFGTVPCQDSEAVAHLTHRPAAFPVSDENDGVITK